jgi:hypothetical protein
MYQVLPGVAAETAVLGSQFAAPLPDPARTALAATGVAIGVYLVAAVAFLIIGFVLRHYGSASRSTAV